MGKPEKVVVWLGGEIKTPPFSLDARLEAGALLGSLQQGVLLSMPHSRPMPTIGKHVHELRIQDETVTWRIIYRVDDDAILVGDVFKKATQETPDRTIKACRRRFALYDETVGEG